MNAASKEDPSTRTERILAVCAIAMMIGAWFVGFYRAEGDLQSYLERTLPEAGFLKLTEKTTYTAWEDDTQDRLMGFVSTGTAHGYGGQMSVAVGVDTAGTIVGLTIIDHKETASFLRRVLRRNFLEQFVGQTVNDAFLLGQDIQGVTGATVSSRALAECIRRASRRIASRNLGLPVIPEPSPPTQWGLPESLLIVMFVTGFIGRAHRFKYTNILRWASMLTGLIFLGFVFNRPLTLTVINRLLLGFWPQWRLDLYWIILLVGIVFVLNADNKNPYCEWFCPFGAAQECLGAIGGARVPTPERLRTPLKWFQRILAFSAIIVALIYRNPSVSSYEVFGALFHLIGSNWQFGLLAVVLVTSLFLKRPWCRYLCPLRPVVDFIRLIRNWTKHLYQKWILSMNRRHAMQTTESNYRS